MFVFVLITVMRVVSTLFFKTNYQSIVHVIGSRQFLMSKKTKKNIPKPFKSLIGTANQMKSSQMFYK